MNLDIIKLNIIRFIELHSILAIASYLSIVLQYTFYYLYIKFHYIKADSNLYYNRHLQKYKVTLFVIH